MIRRIFAVNMLDALVNGFVYVGLPLLLVEKGIDIAAIGVVLALAPLVKNIARVFSASIADQAGYKRFYILNSASLSLGLLAYNFAWAVPVYGAGKVFDGFKDAFMWAVNRASLIKEVGEDKAKSYLNRMASYRTLSMSIGMLLLGIFSHFFGILIAFQLILLAGIASLLISFSMRPDLFGGAKTSASRTISNLKVHGRPKLFYWTSAIMATGTAGYWLLHYLAFPIYLSNAAYSNEAIGFLYAAYFLVLGATTYIMNKFKTSYRTAAVIVILFYTVSIACIPILQKDYTPALFLLAAIGDGAGLIFWEAVIFNVIRKSKTISSDIGILHIPSEASVFFAFLLGGLAIEQFGFAEIFFIQAALMAIFAIASWKVLEKSGYYTAVT